MTINLELLKVSKMTSMKIYIIPVLEKLRTSNFKLQLNLIRRIQFHTPAQEVVMTLPHNQMTNLLMSSCKGATVIKFGQ